MAQKKLQKDSAYQHLDTNNDDTLCDDEISMALEFKRRELEDADARRDSMRYMTWFALFGTLNYPAAILITSMLGYENAATMITDIAPTYLSQTAHSLRLILEQMLTQIKSLKNDSCVFIGSYIRRQSAKSRYVF